MSPSQFTKKIKLISTKSQIFFMSIPSYMLMYFMAIAVDGE